MKISTKLALAGGLLLSTALATTAQAKEPSERAKGVFKHWTADRIANAEPRDLVIDHRGKAYIKGKNGKLTPHGHSAMPELTSPDSKVVKGAIKLDERETRDNQAPTVTSRSPADDATIGSSQTFSAVVTDVDGVRSVTFEITYGGQTYTFAGNNVGNDTWETTVEGFTNGAGSWRVISRDNVKKRGGNTGTTSSYNFTVEGGGNPGGGVVANSRWTAGGAIQTAAGRLLYEMPNGGGWSGYVCSGTVATDGTTGRSVIITAAHCVYDDADASFARNVLFIPNQDATSGSATDSNCFNDPLGCWTADFGVVEQNWTTSVFPNNIPWDYAYYVVSDSGSHSGNGTGGAMDAVTGSIAVDFSAPNVDDGQDGENSLDWTHALGYSYSDDPFFMYSAEDMTTEGSDNWWLPSSQLSGGSSGGPWIQPMDSNGSGPLISVNSWGYNTSDGMAGPFLSGTTAQCVFDAAKLGDLNIANNPDGSQGLVVDPNTCGGGPTNNPPTAAFSDTCTDLSCSFTDGSSDSDGNVTSWAWTFGDGASSSSQNPSHSYGSAGTYTVNLTVTDNDGATNSTSSSVTVTDGGTGGSVNLSSVSAFKVKGKKNWEYIWSGATSSNVDIWLDGSVVTTESNSGSYTLSTNLKGGGSHSHQVCEAGTSVCSSVVNTTF
jgi:PKD repeat protein